MEPLTLDLRLLTIPRREDAQNLLTTVDTATISNHAEGEIQNGNVQSGRKYIILYDLSCLPRSLAVFFFFFSDAIALLQIRLAQHGLRMLDVGDAGDCFFRALSRQMYGEHS